MRHIFTNKIVFNNISYLGPYTKYTRVGSFEKRQKGENIGSKGKKEQSIIEKSKCNVSQSSIGKLEQVLHTLMVSVYHNRRTKIKSHVCSYDLKENVHTHTNTHTNTFIKPTEYQNLNEKHKKIEPHSQEIKRSQMYKWMLNSPPNSKNETDSYRQQ